MGIFLRVASSLRLVLDVPIAEGSLLCGHDTDLSRGVQLEFHRAEPANIKRNKQDRVP